MSLKAIGRMISAKNLTALKQAHSVLGQIIRLAEGEGVSSENQKKAELSRARKLMRRKAGEEGAKASASLCLRDGRIFLKKLQANRLGTMLMDARNEMGLTRSAVAAQLKLINEGELSDIEQGFNPAPPPDVLEELSEFYDLDMDEMMEMKFRDMRAPVNPRVAMR